MNRGEVMDVWFDLITTRTQGKTLFWRKRRFTIAYRGEFTGDDKEQAMHLVNKYKLYRDELYSSTAREKNMISGILESNVFKKYLFAIRYLFGYHVKVKHLLAGKRMHCRDLNEIMQAQHDLQEAAEKLVRWVKTAETFDGRQVVYRINDQGTQHV